jgi:hypothetical protein
MTGFHLDCKHLLGRLLRSVETNFTNFKNFKDFIDFIDFKDLNLLYLHYYTRIPNVLIIADHLCQKTLLLSSLQLRPKL